MCRIYCDTNIYIDLFEGRTDRFRDLGEFALSVFRQVRDKKYKLVISDWLLQELTKYNHDKNFKELLATFEKDHILKIETTKEDKDKARALSKNYPDALHVILAKKANAIYLVTRNLQDFSEFRDIIEITLPESL
jgi:predicted nucleic acid-binding protein